MLVYPKSWKAEALTMPVPGAKMSTHGPKFESKLRTSALVTLPTKSAPGAGDFRLYEHASAAELPAELTWTRPAATARVTARSAARNCRLPKLALMTAGLM